MGATQSLLYKTTYEKCRPLILAFPEKTRAIALLAMALSTGVLLFLKLHFYCQEQAVKATDR
tara:strand:+ start:67 stop:252 length:186 start_codon:yes stop_codon:yes gene_type:complete